MPTRIRPNRLEVSDRFPMLGFTVRSDENDKRFEIAIGTSPDLFGLDGKARRSRSNFYSTRAVGPLAIERRIAPCPNRVEQWCSSHPGTSRREPGRVRAPQRVYAEPDARRRRHGRGRIVTVNCTERRQGDSKVCDTEVVTT